MGRGGIGASTYLIGNGVYKNHYVQPYIEKVPCELCGRPSIKNLGTYHNCSHGRRCQPNNCKQCMANKFNWPICSCGKIVYPRHQGQKYCSKKCAGYCGAIGKKKAKKHNCLSCGTELEYNCTRRYCSDICRKQKQATRGNQPI